MTMRERYCTPVSPDTWTLPAAAATTLTWEYDDGRDRLLSLYRKGKDKQWDATTRIDWDQPVDPYDVAGLPERFNPLLGSDVWERMSEDARAEYGRHMSAWLFSQFLHGEQGALTVSARIVAAYADIGVLDAAKGDLDALMRQDEEIAERADLDRQERELAARRAQVRATIAEGATD